MSERNFRTGGILVLLALVAVAAHFSLIEVGFVFLDSDDATVPIVTDLFRRGEWSPFYLQQNYGGTVLTAIRAGWVALWERLSGSEWSHLTSHMVFTYGVVPVLMSWATFFLVRAYCSLRAAVGVGLLAAVGLQFWIVELYERDFYTAYLLMGFVLLTLRARYRDPLSEMSARGLFWVGALSGFALYTCRASILFVLAFFLTSERVRRWVGSVLKPASAWDRLLAGLGIFFLLLAGYTWVFGSDLGMLFGKHVKTDPFPTLKLSILLMAIAWWKRVLLLSGAPARRRAALVGAGALLGMAPEILYWITHQTVAPALSHGIAEWQAVSATIAGFPKRLQELMGAGDTLLRNASLVLLGLSTFAFGKAASKNPKLSPVLWTAGLSLLAFFGVFQTAQGVSRYLLPLSPVVMVMLGVLLDRALGRGLRSAATVGILALFALHAAHQLEGRAQLVAEARAVPAFDDARGILAAFRGKGVRLVITDEYWHTNQYTYLGHWNPFFISNGRVLGVHEAFELEKQETRVGILLAHSPGGPGWKDPAQVVLNGRMWTLEPLGQAGKVRLYIGTRVSAVQEKA